MIITFANHKGGVGKTALATMMAENLIGEAVPVKLYDLDEQQNFTRCIKAWREDVVVENTLPATMPQGFVIIDTPPAMTGAATERAIRIADRVVVPTDCGVDSISGIKFVLNKNKNISIVINRFLGGRPKIDKNQNITFERGRRKRDQEVFRFVYNNIVKGKEESIRLYVFPENSLFRANLDDGYDWERGISTELYQELTKFALDILRGGSK